ncbi:hypothetical protein [Nonlabens sp. Hel1_33_55]|uniref:hypothetical protein n=1 Tax=Nonlabens sp. Hel1_33_55 TaxID=1336802 RepID=UPI0012FE66EB|nr:hypothetical protein [Nonlabens sp. Hel1_33_55]
MKHYKIQEGKLKMTDSSPLVLAMPFIAVGLTIVSLVLTIVGSRNEEPDFITYFSLALLFTSISVLVWALIKKTFRSELPISDIKQVKQSSVSSSLFYLVLSNGKQRNLSEVRESQRATELLVILREANPFITANFTENEVQTR